MRNSRSAIAGIIHQLPSGFLLSPSPYINRFLQPDTIIPNLADPQSLNRYSYVLNNPLRYTDPTGHRMCEDYQGSCVSENQMTQIQRINQRRNRHYKDDTPKDNPVTTTSPSNYTTTVPALAKATSTPVPTFTPGFNLNFTMPAPCSPCIGHFVPPTPYGTPTPFLYEVVTNPEAKRIIPSFYPTDYGSDLNMLWDDLLEHGLPAVFAVPPTNLSQLVDGVANTAINVSNSIGNVVNNVGWAVGNALDTGIGPTLPIFYIPSTSPLSVPTGSN